MQYIFIIVLFNSIIHVIKPKKNKNKKNWPIASLQLTNPAQ